MLPENSGSARLRTSLEAPEITAITDNSPLLGLGGQIAVIFGNFWRVKSVIVTGMKNQVRFIQYGIEVVRAKLRGERLPLPLAAAPDTS
jgi:hypothetical protein